MKFGITSQNSALTMLPADLGVEVEQRGFHSVWFGEHSHIPFPSETDFFFEGLLEPSNVRVDYNDMGRYIERPDFIQAVNAEQMNPLISLASIAGVTSRIRLGTSVCLALQHDLIDLAKQVATLDVISNGRVELGVGLGWRADELATHRPDLPWNKRYAALRDRVAAMRAIWADDVSSYEGEWDHLKPSWIFPKPVNRSVPILIGGEGPLTRSHAISYCDKWLPHERARNEADLWREDGKPTFATLLEEFESELEKRGRARTSTEVWLQLLLCPSAKLVEAYAKLGIEYLHVCLPPQDHRPTRDEVMRMIDQVQPLLEKFPE